MAIKSEWIVASTTARNALTVTDADVQLGAECKVNADGAIYRAVRSGTGATMWAASDAESEFDASEVGGVLAGTDVLTMSRSGTIYTMLMSRIATYIGTALNVTSGTWTPTGTIVTNLDAVTPGTGNYMRVGSTVAAAVRVQVDPTAAAAIQFDISLPVTSAIGSADDAIGVASGSNTTLGRAQGNATDDRLSVFATSSSTSANNVMVVFLYRVI
jgi:hypothetical protein